MHRGLGGWFADFLCGQRISKGNIQSQLCLEEGVGVEGAVSQVGSDTRQPCHWLGLEEDPVLGQPA